MTMNEKLGALFITAADLAELWLLFYFYAKMTCKKPKPLYFPLFLLPLYFVLTAFREYTFLKLAAAAGGLYLFGALACGARRRYAALHALLALETVQLCCGVSNSVTAIFFAAASRAVGGAAGSAAMILGSVLSLSLAYFCCRMLVRHFLPRETEESSYLGMILVPLLTLFLLGEYINYTVYGNTVTVAEHGYWAAPGDLQLFLIQLSALLSLFCILYAYKKLLRSAHIATKLALLEQEKEFQRQYVAEAGERYERTKAFRHDLRNHLSVLGGLMERGDFEQARAYLRSMKVSGEELSFPYATGNPVVDILLQNKLAPAAERGVEVACSLTLPRESGIDDMDFCILISNALDNALKAVDTQGGGRAYIRLSGRRQGDFLLIDIENSYGGGEMPPAGTGLSNIRAASEKYNGAVNISYDGASFSLGILLVIPQQPARIS